jgi:hypothetical protein
MSVVGGPSGAEGTEAKVPIAQGKLRQAGSGGGPQEPRETRENVQPNGSAGIRRIRGGCAAGLRGSPDRAARRDQRFTRTRTGTRAGMAR